jgi:hypothetical protein
MTDDLKLALELVDIEYDAEDLLRSRDDPLRKYKDVPEVPGCKSFGALIPLLLTVLTHPTDRLVIQAV